MNLAPFTSENHLIDGINPWMAVKSLGHNVTDFLRTVALTAKIKTLVSHAFQNIGPFLGFQ